MCTFSANFAFNKATYERINRYKTHNVVKNLVQSHFCRSVFNRSHPRKGRISLFMLFLCSRHFLCSYYISVHVISLLIPLLCSHSFSVHIISLFTEFSLFILFVLFTRHFVCSYYFLCSRQFLCSYYFSVHVIFSVHIISQLSLYFCSY